MAYSKDKYIKHLEGKLDDTEHELEYIREGVEDDKTQLLITHRAFDKQKDIIKGQINTLQREELIKAPTSSALQNEIDALFKLFLDTQIIATKLIQKINREVE